MLFCILLLITTPTFSDLSAIASSVSVSAPFSRAPGRDAPSSSFPARRVAPLISESASETTDPAARARGCRARRPRDLEVLTPSLRLLLREAGREAGEDRQLRGGELHRLARVLLADTLHLEQH